MEARHEQVWLAAGVRRLPAPRIHISIYRCQPLSHLRDSCDLTGQYRLYLVHFSLLSLSPLAGSLACGNILVFFSFLLRLSPPFAFIFFSFTAVIPCAVVSTFSSSPFHLFSIPVLQFRRFYVFPIRSVYFVVDDDLGNTSSHMHQMICCRLFWTHSKS